MGLAVWPLRMVVVTSVEHVQTMQKRTSRMVRRVRVVHAILRNVRRMDRHVCGAHLKFFFHAASQTVGVYADSSCLSMS